MKPRSHLCRIPFVKGEAGLRKKKKNKQSDDKWDFFSFVDLIEPLFYLLRWAVRGIVKIIN